MAPALAPSPQSVHNASVSIARDMTFSDADRLSGQAAEAASPLEMDEDAFRAFYDRTARILWAYLSRMTGDPQAADDLLQEAYYRFIRAGARLEGEAHQRHYLFRIATNLVNDRHRRRRPPEEPLDEDSAAAIPAQGDHAERLERRRHLQAAMSGLKRRERELLWLAYAEGSSHQEIADILGLQPSGIRVLLFRARRKLAMLLGRTFQGRNGGTSRGE
jgi:RNA polymerase sigma-70 factor, ECF subfamily